MANTKAKKKESSKEKDKILSSSVLNRNHRLSLLLNEKEKESIDSYCKKHKIKNRSKFLRDTIMRTVMDHFLEDYPVLFDKKDMDRIKI